MKYILTISLIIFLSTGCLGQYPKLKVSPTGNVYNSNSTKIITFEEADSLSKIGTNVRVKWDTTENKVYYEIGQVTLLKKNKIDTVFSFLLMSDISDSSGTMLNGNGIAFWQMGWEILENDVSVGYLDFDKVPFPENIIIWQSKQY